MFKFWIYKLLRFFNLVSKERFHRAEAFHRLRHGTNYRLIAKSKYFNKRWYLKRYPDVRKSGMDPVLHYMDYGWKEGRETGTVFSGNWYLKKHPDVKKAKVNPLIHYLRCGIKEGRKGIAVDLKVYDLIKRSSWFDARWYVSQYPDVAKSGMDPLLHYLVIGWKKEYDPSPKFSTSFYLTTYEDVKKVGMCPLHHYIAYGRREHRVPSATKNTAKFSFPKSRIVSYVMRKFFQCLNYGLIRKNRDKRIAVHLHLYYPELWSEIKLYLSNLECYKYKLFITYTQELPLRTEEDIRAFNEDVSLFRIENRGFDLGGFIYFLQNAKLNKFDVLFKMHTKRNTVGHNYYGLYMQGSDWRRFLYDAVLGERTVHRVIDVLADAESKVGLIAHEKLITDRDLRYNREETVRAMARFGFALPEKYEYVAGTMFAAKPVLFENIKKNVTIKDFEISTRGYFTLAHCFERILALNAAGQGYELAGVKTFDVKALWRNRQAKKHPFRDLGLLDAKLLPKYEFYDFTTRNKFKFLVSSALKEKNPEFYHLLMKNMGVVENASARIDERSVRYQILLKDLILDRKVAKISKRMEDTVFSLAGNDVMVEKISKSKPMGRLQISSERPVFIRKGVPFPQFVDEHLDPNNVGAVVASLIPFFDAAFDRFKSRRQDKLSPNAWDAIVRNAVVNTHGGYEFFDCNIIYLPGVPKFYYIFRVLFDLSLMPKFEKHWGRLDQAPKGNVYRVYDELCRHYHLKPNFYYAKRLERHLQLSLANSLPNSMRTAEFLMMVLCRAGFAFLTEMCNDVWFGFGCRIRRRVMDFALYILRLCRIVPARDAAFDATYKMIDGSGLFDKKMYLSTYPDVKDSGVNPIVHYLMSGWQEGRAPSEEFNGKDYLDLNPDLRQAKINPLVHYLKHGVKEGRAYKKVEPAFPVNAKCVTWKATGKQRGKCNHVAIFSSFSADGKIADYVLYYLRGLKKVCDSIIFIADNPIVPGEIEKIKGLVAFAQFKRHREYDFGSYKRGYKVAIELGLVDSAHEMVLCNDSCYGPVFPFAEMFGEMKSRGVDFWGVTANRQFGYHLQSYFMVFTSTVFKSKCFADFLSAVKEQGCWLDVIYNYETKFTKALMDVGFTADSYIALSPNGEGKPWWRLSNAMLMPNYLMFRRCPIIKRKAFTNEDCNYEGIRETIVNVESINSRVARFLPREHMFCDENYNSAFSVILPVRKVTSELYNTIDSVLAQTYGRFELIVSGCDSADVLSELLGAKYGAYLDNGVIKYLSKPGANSVELKNAAIAIAKNEWICYVNANDVYYPYFLESLVKRTVDPSVKTCYWLWQSMRTSQISKSVTFNLDQIRRNCFIELGEFAHHKSVSSELGCFYEGDAAVSERDLIVRYVSKYVPVFIKLPLFLKNDVENR